MHEIHLLKVRTNTLIFADFYKRRRYDLFVFICPIITQKPHDRFASNWEPHFKSLAALGTLEWDTFTPD